MVAVSQATCASGSSRENRIEHRVGDLVADFVRVTFGHRLRREIRSLRRHPAVAVVAHLLLECASFDSQSAVRGISAKRILCGATRLQMPRRDDAYVPPSQDVM